VYNRQQDYNAQPKNVAKGRKFQFKNDYERMQALIGRYGVAPACQRQ
jgi:hypothetical protein